MRLQGTKKDIRWFLKKIERDKRWRIDCRSRHETYHLDNQ